MVEHSTVKGSIEIWQIHAHIEIERQAISKQSGKEERNSRKWQQTFLEESAISVDTIDVSARLSFITLMNPKRNLGFLNEVSPDPGRSLSEKFRNAFLSARIVIEKYMQD